MKIWAAFCLSWYFSDQQERRGVPELVTAIRTCILSRNVEAASRTWILAWKRRGRPGLGLGLESAPRRDLGLGLDSCDDLTAGGSRLQTDENRSGTRFYSLLV